MESARKTLGHVHSALEALAIRQAALAELHAQAVADAVAMRDAAHPPADAQGGQPHG